MPELKFTKPTDEPHEIELESELVSVGWNKDEAFAGTTAGFTVKTYRVGNGATIKITGKSVGGAALGEIDEVIVRNKFTGMFDIPTSIEREDEVFFEVELPDNDLNFESPAIPVHPVVSVYNLKWSAEDAKDGDELTLSAETSNVADDTEATIKIYEHDQNQAHDSVTEIQTTVQGEKIEVLWQCSYHGNVNDFPSEQEAEQYGFEYARPQFFFTVKVGEKEFGKGQESGLLNRPFTRFQLCDHSGDPHAEIDYRCELDGEVVTGKTDSDGWTQEMSVTAKKKGLIIFANSRYTITFSEEETDETIAAKSALNGLGFSGGLLDASTSSQLEKALRQFQKEMDLEPTGELDDATKDALEKAHIVEYQ